MASGANPPPENDDMPGILKDIKSTVGMVIIFATLFGMIVFFSRDVFPRFQLDSVSVSVRDNNTTAAWDIGFTINEHVGDLGAWVRFMGQDFKAGSSVGSAGKSSVSLSTSLPRGFDLSGGGLTLEQVVFNCNNCGGSTRYILKAACKEVDVVGFWSNETVGDLKGGPRLCPLVFHERIRRGGRGS